MRMILAAVGAALLLAPPARATLIDFDQTPSGTVIDTTYENEGVLFSGAVVENLTGTGIATSTPPNAAVALDEPFLSFTFVGTLPNYVSFTVSTAAQDSVEAVAVTASGGQIIERSSGYAGPNSTPYVPNDLLVFSAADIEKITLYDFFDLRADIAMDTLYFGCAAPVPEPATWLLLGAPLLLLWRASRRGAGLAPRSI